MKIIKYVFLLLLLSVVAVSVFIATQEGKYDIKKERVIRVPKTVLYNYINEFKNWENVGILTGSDTTAVFTYTGKTSGTGAQMSWVKGSNTGKVQTVKIAENDSILQKAVIDNLNSEISWGFKDTLKSTKVTVRLTGNLSFSEKANALLRGGGNVNKAMEASLDKGLENLDNFLVKELAVNSVEVKGLMTKLGAFYIGHAVTSKIEDINRNSAEMFPKLINFMKTNKIVKKGSPFILYKNYDKAKGTASYMVCIPIKDEMFTSPGSEYEGGKIADFNALKTTLKGDYSHLPKAWDAAHTYITEKGLQENTTGTYVELYTKGMQKTKRPSEWVTDLYVPIGAPTILPVIDSLQPTVTPIKPAAVTPTTGGVRPVTSATGIKPTGSATARPAATGSKPLTTATGTKPATTPKPTGSSNATAKPATTTVKPATPKPAPATEKPVTQPTTTP